MKKLFVLLLCLSLCLPCAFSLAEEAGEAVPEILTCGDFEYALLEDGTAEITKYLGKAETLEVPSELDGHNVISIADEAFFYCSDLTSVTIPDSVTSIGVNPFMLCNNLTQIVVSPDYSALATIGGVFFSKADKRLITYPCAFSDSEYTIPQGIEIIGDNAFSFCDNLTSVTIPDSVTSIGTSAFSWCDSLTEITVGRDSYARQYCIDNDLPYTYADANDWLNG